MEWQSACGGQQGALYFKLASARRGQGEQGACKLLVTQADLPMLRLAATVKWSGGTA